MRSLSETLEELRPGVGKRNGRRTCIKCGLVWIECRCEIYIPSKMTTDEDDIPESESTHAK